jgi:NAD(P)-dependent dehydrogenase (short-subunit alcohol dehydrogenase family)
MDLQLTGKKAIVTGASRGIGRAIARQLALEGCDVAICARTAGPLQEAAAALAHESGRQAERRLSEIPCATLALFGSEDKMVAPEAARIYRARIPNGNIAFVYDAGHLIEAERPEALVNAVSDYVELRETFIVGRQTGIVNP